MKRQVDLVKLRKELARSVEGEDYERAAKLRDEIKSLAGRITSRTHVAARLSSAVLGHLNTVVRLLAGAVEKAGLYTKHGVPSVSSRIGVMEAVG